MEQTLDSCQLKRVKSAVVKVDLRWLCNHLARWSLLGRDFNLQELALISVFAKQVGSWLSTVSTYNAVFVCCDCQMCASCCVSIALRNGNMSFVVNNCMVLCLGMYLCGGAAISSQSCLLARPVRRCMHSVWETPS